MIRRDAAALVGLVLLGSASTAAGQVLQLPTFHSFGVSTSVVVPDRGAAYLGGSDRSAAGWSEFGAPWSPLNHRGLGILNQAGTVSVSAYVHDFAAMDEQLLSQAGGRTASAAVAPLRSGTSTAAQPAQSVAALRAQHSAASDPSREVVELVERGQVAEREGKLGAARLYYQMAARRATGVQREQIIARLAVLDGHGPRTAAR